MAAQTGAGVVWAARGRGEEPPAENTTLKFQKTLYVHKSEKGKIFAETRKITSGDTIWRVLREEYGVSEEVMVSLVDVFREVNPGVNPNNLTAGQVVRVPFKIESDAGAPPAPPAPAGDYIVRPGDTLWKVLKNVYGVKKDEMKKVMAVVASANPGVKDINRLWVGQVLVIPAAHQEKSRPASDVETKEEEKKSGVPAYFTSVLEVLEKLSCRIDRTGETFIPVERGKSLRLAASEFPIVESPTGKKVVLDPTERLSPALRNSLARTWDYATVQSARADAQEYLDVLIPALGFYEAARSTRQIPLADGAMLSANVLWSVAPVQRDLWDGRIHLLFPKGMGVDPDLAALAREKGFITHRLSTDQEKDEAKPEPRVVGEIDLSDPVEGAAKFLIMAGILAETGRELPCRLDGGVTYNVETKLSFEVGGVTYAVPPESPARAESILSRAGYLTFTIPGGAPPLERLKDLLQLAGIPHKREEVVALPGGGFSARVEALVIDSPALSASVGGREAGIKRPVLVTPATLDSRVAGAFAASGYLPVKLR